MRISYRYTVAIHILAALEIKRDVICTSEVLAGSIHNNPVVVRRIIGMLKKADLVGVHGGQSGTYLLKSATEITLLDVYKAVNIAEDGKLFQVHEDTNQSCTIGANIQNALASILPKAQSAMEDVLREYTISDVAAQILALRQE